MRVVLFGSTGLIGKHIVAELRRRGIDVVTEKGERTDIRVANYVELFLQRIHRTGKIDYVINAAGYAHVDNAETNADEAYKVNALGAENVAQAAAFCGARGTVHLSTEYVFDGNNDVRSLVVNNVSPAHITFDEYATPIARSIYAKSKRAGEVLVARATGNHQIIRLQSIYDTTGIQFLSKIRGLLLSKQERLAFDSVRQIQPTWAGTAAKMIVDIMELPQTGIFHASARGAATYSRFARRMAEKLGIPDRRWSAPLTNSQVVNRSSILLEHRRLEMLGITPPTWEESMDDFLKSVS